MTKIDFDFLIAALGRIRKSYTGEIDELRENAWDTLLDWLAVGRQVAEYDENLKKL